MHKIITLSHAHSINSSNFQGIIINKIEEEEEDVMEFEEIMEEMHSRLARGQSQIDLTELGEELRSKSGKQVSNFIKKHIKFLEKIGCFFVRKNSAVIWIF